MPAQPSSFIKITGARQHNLRNLSVDIPRHQLVVITGVSGSGKSSLAFDTLYAEGQRRYVESLSAYARQFLEQIAKPDVDFIEGLSPAIAIEQRGSAPNPRSTIATTTEIYDYLRILYAAIGKPHDPKTGEALIRHTTHDIVEALCALPEKSRLILLAPVTPPSDAESQNSLILSLQKQGFVRIRIDGAIIDLEDSAAVMKKKSPRAVEIVIDRLVIRSDVRTRLADSVETALKWSHQHRLLAITQEDAQAAETLLTFTTTYTNPNTGFTLGEITPRHFSFNSHLGACPSCHGLGNQLHCDPTLLVPEPDKSLNQGAIKTWWSKNKKLRATQDRQIMAVAAHFQADPDAPFEDLDDDFKTALFEGTGDTSIASGLKSGKRTISKPYEGLIHQAQRLWETSDSPFTRRNVKRYMNSSPCTRCQGRRLKKSILAITLPHQKQELSIDQFIQLSIEDAGGWLDRIKLTDSQQSYAQDILKQIHKRLDFLNEVGLSYLTLDRPSASLSGGEAQRIRLATQLGAGLSGVLYVLDEPSIGLHQSDNDRLLTTLKNLRDLDNTVIVVEHDEDTIRAADYVLDLGPGAGSEGGHLLAHGTPEEIAQNPASITGQFLSKKRHIPLPKPAPHLAALFQKNRGTLDIINASEHNLKNITARFPIGYFTCVTGVSGSGKSTLIDDILRRAVAQQLHRAKVKPGVHSCIKGLDQIDKMIVVDQSPIGRSPRSNPATYSGLFDPIRELFAKLPAARARGYKGGRFSFNVSGGRCENCQGDGSIKIDMHFMSDVYVTCEACQGKRYNRETLDIAYRGKNIAEVLAMTINEAYDFFQKLPLIEKKLRALKDVGLGYIALGQAATTLSGGEAQRIKLASELAKNSTGKTLYLLDEPTTGLHFADIEILLEVFYRLRDAGNTLIVIEHNLDIIKCADWIIDLGPGGGKHGGEIVASGTPQDIAKDPNSLTGQYLKRHAF
ncbi:MAG: excinuclease ABC subunit UvrA [Verrucomicrobiales bacterium]|nr:excinuclease ABC subunit UvrA [Verrucomicrobiales bacterium]